MACFSQIFQSNDLFVRQESHASKENYGWMAYLAYFLYIPLYLAGPVLSFNAWISQVAPSSPSPSFISPTVSTQHTILDTLSSADLFFAPNPAPSLAHASWDSRALSDSRVKRTSLPLTTSHSISSLISPRYYYYYYIDEHVEIWSRLAPWEITMTACFTLVYMYMKFLCIWRTFRCWSLLDGLRPSQLPPPLLSGCSLGWMRLI